MASRLENAELLHTFKSDDRGRVNFGTDYANKELEIAILESQKIEEHNDET